MEKRLRTNRSSASIGRRRGGSARRASPRAANEGRNGLVVDLEILSDPTRLALVHFLCRASEPVCVCELERAVPVKQPTVSHHLRVLRQIGLVSSEKRGQWAYYTPIPSALAALRQRIHDGLGTLVK
jgi:ArsR family transcriptional regulator